MGTEHTAVKVMIPAAYVAPADGYDWCFSCNYLEEVAEEYALPDGSEIVPLCAECVEGSGN